MSGANKKSVSKDDLRRLMEESQKRSSDERKIDSPLARYNSLGQLSCLVCNCPIKNEVLWKAHVLKKEHKMNIEHYKTQTVQRPQGSDRESNLSASNSSAVKRKATDAIALPGKEKLPKFVETSSESRTASNPLQQNSGKPGFKSSVNNGSEKVCLIETSVPSEDESSSDSDMAVDNDVLQKQISQPFPTNVDSSSATKASAMVIKEQPSSSLSGSKTGSFPEGLPEGFIDDPVLDAKVRNVPYKDKMEEQLELFQKEMKLQETVSEALLEDDDEQRDAERQIYAVEERMFNYSRVLRLVEMKRQANISNVQLKSNVLEKMDQDDDDEDDEEAEEDLLDWRSKAVFKK